MKYLKMAGVVILVLAVALPFALSACAPEEAPPAAPPAEQPTAPPAAPAPAKITFGCAIAISGWCSSDAAYEIKNYDLWADDVNAKGGIYVKEYDKRIPVEMKYYDDKSDPGTTAKMVEKLILEDKVDFLVAPWGTAWHFAVAPLADKYGYQMIGVYESSDALMGKYPYYFKDYPPPGEAGPIIVDLLSGLGVKSAAILYVSTLYGIEYAGSLGPALAGEGISCPIMESYPYDILDFSPLLKMIRDAGVDALLVPCYGPDGALLTEQMIALDYNPNLVWLGSASWSSPLYLEKFGKAGIEGIMSETGWNPYAPITGAKEYYDRYVAKWGEDPDMGCGPYTYATMQVYEQAIEKAGTLDRAKVNDVMARETFSTVGGPIKFVDQYNPNENYAMIVGQWQQGIYQPVAPKDKREASGIQVIYPKPPWPE